MSRDHKSDLAMDLKEELEQARAIAQRLQQDKRDLADDAKATRAYRDEIEMLKVQSGKVEKLEADVIKYKQKLEDTEYLKKKIAVSDGRGGGERERGGKGSAGREEGKGGEEKGRGMGGEGEGRRERERGEREGGWEGREGGKGGKCRERKGGE